MVLVQLRTYPAPDKSSYYFFADLGMDVYAGDAGYPSKQGPTCRLGIGILSKSNDPLEVFVDGGCKVGHVEGSGFYTTSGEFCWAAFFRGGVAF
ncbi:MAG: hypothetical protein PHR28_01675 [candidate division Zixibacteria bacterium]|nr:hypothetical protein [candidate division Zixibacteria bacterium]